MALTSTITPAKVAVALGQSAPSGAVASQWQMWIDDALMLIDTRAVAEGVTPDQVKLDYVIREAVVAQVKRPDDATQVTISVDDAASTKTYKSGTGRVGILDEWWKLLGIGALAGRAFELDTMPKDAGSGKYGVDYWWSSPTDQVPIT